MKTMILHLVNANGECLSIDVANRAEADRLFSEAVESGETIGATLRSRTGGYIDNLVRWGIEPETHHLVTDRMIKAGLAARQQEREDDEPTHNGQNPWVFGGMCHLVSEFMAYKYGMARIGGTVMMADLHTPICVHYWCITKDQTIVDMTADQLYEGASYRIIPKGHPDWYRYQPEYGFPEDLESLRGCGVYSDAFIDLVIARAASIEAYHEDATDLSHLGSTPGSEELRKELEPMLVELYDVATRELEQYLGKSGRKTKTQVGFVPAKQERQRHAPAEPALD
ncbi:hypothetical protein HNP46_000017 [Pseudomonas nitritireducens]|uniref:Uncharacterized protein n=1 Tax=Pseudomonas nitroreducens TaxID=46680 RepID=A0A7W7KE69_PSENT|nr:hypothetical protein [Pseudomonas nitritireducens]MBB4861206.1 hypothetical protein [Pseudomonas nitritireducens]